MLKLSRFDWFMVFLVVAITIATFIFTGCAPTSDPAPEPAPPPIEQPTEVADLEMGYGAYGYWSFDNHATMPYATASVYSKTAWDSGKVVFSIRGLDYAKITNADTFLFMAKLKTPNGKEGNFQYNIADKIPRLISQRFDGTCANFCEHQSHGGVAWNPAETYSFSFEWNATTVALHVRDSSGNTVHSGSVPTDGAYAGVDWVRVGNGVMTAYGWAQNDIVVINPYLE